jgi:hypothetical protein
MGRISLKDECTNLIGKIANVIGTERLRLEQLVQIRLHQPLHHVTTSRESINNLKEWLQTTTVTRKKQSMKNKRY